MASCIIKDRKDMASAIVGMPFGDLMDVARELVEMSADPEVERKLDTPLGMAEMLWDWAEAQTNLQ